MPKIRVSIGDVLDQPLAVLDTAIASMLRRPQRVDGVEAKAIFEQLSALFQRCSEAIAIGAGEPIAACMRLVQEGFMVSDVTMEQGIACFLANPQYLDEMVRLLQQCVVEKRVDAEAQLEVFHTLDFLCDAAQTKEIVGEKVLGTLSGIMGDTTRPYNVLRCCATSMICLMKQSKLNKARLTDCEFCARALSNTSDFFFQLQCVELLYRVLRTNKAILDNLSLPKTVLEGIEKLPNDSNLLRKIVSLLEDWNEKKNPKQSLMYRAARVDAGSNTIAGATTIYFSSEILIIGLPSGIADNVTIPFSYIRSVKISKGSRFGIRLHRLPAMLEPMMNLMTGDDTVTLHLTATTLAALKASSVHQWIVKALQDAAAQQEQRELKSKSVAAVTGGSPKRSRDPHTATVTAPADEEKRISVRDANSPAAGSAKKVRRGESKAKSASKAKASTPPQDDAPMMDDASPVLDGAPPAPPSHSTTHLQLGSMLEQLANGHDSLNGGGANDSFNLSQYDTPRGDGDSIEDMLSQLRNVIQDRVGKKRNDAVSILNDVLGGIQDKLDAAKQENREDRQQYEQKVLRELNEIRAAESSVRDRVVTSVADLNNGLQEIQQIGQVIKDNISCVEIEFQQVIEQAREVEEQQLQRLKSRVEEEMGQMEAKLNQYIEASNPLRFLTSYLTRKMAEE